MGPIRFINTTTLELEELGDIPLRYAILSHRWVDEVTLQQWKNRCDDLEITKRSGYVKIQAFCKLASDDGFDYVWVDTNCIDKTNSSELSEAINSMFTWYRDAARCYVYLHDLEFDESREVPELPETASCEWFSRGWTLQELLAPHDLWFYSKNWTCLGSKSELSDILSRLTGIDRAYLYGTHQIHDASIAKRMSWASNRQTGKGEDLAYSLLGIFDINMPLIYGEGSLKAFRRLQEEIIKVSTDQTIFAWEWPQDWRPQHPDWISFFAPSPSAFKNSGNFISPNASESHTRSNDLLSHIYSMNNLGLSITLPILDALSREHYSFAVLRCISTSNSRLHVGPIPFLGIPVYHNGAVYARLPYPPAPMPLNAPVARGMEPIHVCRHGNQSMTRAMRHFDEDFRFPSLHQSDGSSRYLFMCFSRDRESFSSQMRDSGVTLGHSLYPSLGLYIISLASNEETAAGAVLLENAAHMLNSPTEELSLYLGVTLRRGVPSYHCKIQSAEKSANVRDKHLGLWTKEIGQYGTDFRDTARGIGGSSECSSAMVHLGNSVDMQDSVFIPVYIGLKKRTNL